MNAWPILLAQNDGGDAAGGILGLLCSCMFPLMSLAFFVVSVVGAWKVFEKAGQPGWAAIIPIYNYYVLNQIAGKDILWFVLLVIPCTFPIAMIVVCLDVAKNFGKDALYGIGLALLSPIFFPMLGFSDAKYIGPAPKQM